MSLNSVAVEDVVWIKDIPYPRGVQFRQLIITGPPSSGKTTLIQKLQGWPEEGYVDLAQNDWWRSPVLTLRPPVRRFSGKLHRFRPRMARRTCSDWPEAGAHTAWKALVL